MPAPCLWLGTSLSLIALNLHLILVTFLLVLVSIHPLARGLYNRLIIFNSIPLSVSVSLCVLAVGRKNIFNI